MLTFFMHSGVVHKKTQKITKNCTQFLPVIFEHFSSAAANKATNFWLSIERFPNGLTLMMMMMSAKLIISRFGMNE